MSRIGSIDTRRRGGCEKKIKKNINKEGESELEKSCLMGVK
jgi:hypothetical protein